MRRTATKHAPWYVIPADNNVYAPRGGLGDHRNADGLHLASPTSEEAKKKELQAVRASLLSRRISSSSPAGCAGQMYGAGTSPPQVRRPRSTTERVIYLQGAAHPSRTYKNSNSLLHIHLSVRPPHPGNTNSPKQSKPMQTSYGNGWSASQMRQPHPSQSRREWTPAVQSVGLRRSFPFESLLQATNLTLNIPGSTTAYYRHR